jgi:hypothetical protein
MPREKKQRRRRRRKTTKKFAAISLSAAVDPTHSPVVKPLVWQRCCVCACGGDVPNRRHRTSGSSSCQRRRRSFPCRDSRERRRRRLRRSLEETPFHHPRRLSRACHPSSLRGSAVSRLRVCLTRSLKRKGERRCSSFNEEGRSTSVSRVRLRCANKKRWSKKFCVLHFNFRRSHKPSPPGGARLWANTLRRTVFGNAWARQF